jgi:hypothetical protein
MAPPPVGTPEYRKYLDKQNARKMKLRKTINKIKKRREARPLISKAVQAATGDLRAQLAEQVVRKNRCMRQLSIQRAKADSCFARFEITSRACVPTPT